MLHASCKGGRQHPSSTPIYEKGSAESTHKVLTSHYRNTVHTGIQKKYLELFTPGRWERPTLVLYTSGRPIRQHALEELMRAGDTRREALLGNPVAAPTDPAQAYKSPSVLAAERSLAQLEQTQRIAADTERLGMSIMGQLVDQRGQLTEAIDRRDETHQSLTASSRLIRQMHNRATWTKIMLFAIIGGMLIAILVLGWYFWLGPGCKNCDNKGRALQDASQPASPPLGPGVIILAVFGVFFLGLCFWAYPRGLVTRTLVCAATTVLYAFLLLVLLLVPRQEPPDAQSPFKLVDDKYDLIGRVILVSLSVLIALCGLGCVVAEHVARPQKAPVVADTKSDVIEAFRLKP